MTKVTITEALAEIKLITNKVSKKKARIIECLVKYKHIPDPVTTVGGTPEFIKSETKSINDLEANLVRIRQAIMKANIEHTLDCMGTTKTIYEWLCWKREVYQGRILFYQHVYDNTKRAIDTSLKASPQVTKNPNGDIEVVQLDIMVDYMAYSQMKINESEIYEKLDGLLSLKNATILIDIS